MSEKEIEEFEASVGRAGLKCFLSPGQLEEIIKNLRHQTLEFTPEQLGAALDYYWRHDAFIDLSKLQA